MTAPTCPYCGKAAELSNYNEIYDTNAHNGEKLFYWICKPCNAYAKCVPMGSKKPRDSWQTTSFAELA